MEKKHEAKLARLKERIAKGLPASDTEDSEEYSAEQDKKELEEPLIENKEQ
jgi:hypothetical protein